MPKKSNSPLLNNEKQPCDNDSNKLLLNITRALARHHALRDHKKRLTDEKGRNLRKVLNRQTE